MIHNHDRYFGTVSNLIDSIGKKMANESAGKTVAGFSNNPIGENDIVALKSKLQPDIGRDS